MKYLYLSFIYASLVVMSSQADPVTPTVPDVTMMQAQHVATAEQQSDSPLQISLNMEDAHYISQLFAALPAEDKERQDNFLKEVWVARRDAIRDKYRRRWEKARKSTNASEIQAAQQFYEALQAQEWDKLSPDIQYILIKFIQEQGSSFFDDECKQYYKQMRDIQYNLLESFRKILRGLPQEHHLCQLTKYLKSAGIGCPGCAFTWDLMLSILRHSLGRLTRNIHDTAALNQLQRLVDVLAQARSNTLAHLIKDLPTIATELAEPVQGLHLREEFTLKDISELRHKLETNADFNMLQKAGLRVALSKVEQTSPEGIALDKLKVTLLQTVKDEQKINTWLHTIRDENWKPEADTQTPGLVHQLLKTFQSSAEEQPKKEEANQPNKIAQALIDSFQTPQAEATPERPAVGRLDLSRLNPFQNAGESSEQKNASQDSVKKLDPSRLNAFQNTGASSESSSAQSSAVKQLDAAKLSAFQNAGESSEQKNASQDSVKKLDPSRLSAFQNAGASSETSSAQSSAVKQLDAAKLSAFQSAGASSEQKNASQDSVKKLDAAKLASFQNAGEIPSTQDKNIKRLDQSRIDAFQPTR